MTAIAAGELASVSESKVTDAVYLNQAVEEVFGLMLGVAVGEVSDEFLAEDATATMTAMVGLAGAISGTCAMLVKSEAGIHMASCMAGMELNAVDETVLDGLGEITHMLAGAWKAKIPGVKGGGCLSVNSV